MTNEFEVKTKMNTKSDTEQDLENARDKIIAGEKAVAGKIENPNRNLGSEHDKEEIKENVN
jgi:hypothetical protein